MAYADSLTVKVGTEDVVLNRTGMSLSEGAFSSQDRKYGFTVKHSYTKRNRHVGQLKFSDIVPNPLVEGRNIPTTFHAHLVVDTPIQGATNVQVEALTKAIVAFFAVPANVQKLIAGES